MKRFLTLLGAAVASWCCAHVASAQVGNGVVVSLSLASGNLSQLQAGTTLVYNVNISGLKGSANNPGSPVVGGYDLTLDFDSTLLTPQSVNFNTYLGGTQSYLGPNDTPSTDFTTPGQAYFGEFTGTDAQTLISQQSAAFTLATITFQAQRSGTGTITWDSSSSMSNENAGTLDVVRYVGSSVPEPGTYVASLLGIAALGGYAWRRRAVTA